jgi:hypothetical protein
LEILNPHSKIENGMKSKLLFFAFIVAGIANAQSPNWSWAKSSVGSGDDEALGTSCDKRGNVFVAGWFSSSSVSFASNILMNAGNSKDVFIAKYDSLGNVIWAKSAGGNADDEATSVASDTSGNTYVVGYFESPTITFGSTTLTNASVDADIFIVKYDTVGNVLWAKRFGASNTDLAYSVCTDVSGKVYMTGYFMGPSITFGSTTLTSAGFTDMYLVKFDSNGNVVLAKRAGGSDSDDVGSSVCIDTSGNIYVTGFFYSSSMSFGSVGIFNTDNTGFSVDMFIVKYDPNGNAIWAKSSSGGMNDEYPQSVVADASGNSYVVGYFYSPSITFGSITLTNADNSGNTVDFFIVKYNSAGNVIWARSAGGGIANDLPGSVAVDPSGNIYTAGGFGSATISFGTFNLNGTGGFAMFLVKYDANGNVLWAKNADGSGGEGASGVTANISGNVFVTGAFNSPSLSFGSSTLTNAGITSVYIAKLDNDITGLGNSGISTAVKIYPIPSAGIFHLDLNETNFSNINVVVTNLIGEIIYESIIQNSNGSIDLSDQVNGIYFVNLKTNNESFTQKIILQK